MGGGRWESVSVSMHKGLERPENVKKRQYVAEKSERTHHITGGRWIRLVHMLVAPPIRAPRAMLVIVLLRNVNVRTDRVEVVPWSCR